MARSARSTHVIAAACLVAALFAPGSAAARVTPGQVEDAAAHVRTALKRAEAAGALAPGPAATYRASLRKAMQVARQLDTPSKHGRLDELGGNVVQMARLARRGRFTAERYPALFRQLDANRVWFAARGAPQERVPVRVPGDPLIYEEWPGYGLQLHPLQNFKRANAHWFAGDDAALGELLDALLPLAVPQTGGWVTWEYYFDYGGGQAPWHSAMPQGMAVQVLARAAGTLGRDDLLEVAQRALKGLGRPVQSRGLVDLTAGRWWPLYAFNPGQRVLNGDLQVVISLYDYAALTGDPVAAVWAEEGAETALAALPRYDTGAWSMYDQSHESDAGYHALMAEQLQTLAGRLKLAAFQPFAERFADYLVAPPALAPASDGPLVFYPKPRDGFLDRRRLDVLLDKPAVADRRGARPQRPRGRLRSGSGSAPAAASASAGTGASAPAPHRPATTRSRSARSTWPATARCPSTSAPSPSPATRPRPRSGSCASAARAGRCACAGPSATPGRPG